MNTTTKGRIFVPGGAGYVGAVLVPRLLELGYEVHVLDLYIYGEAALDAVKDHPRLRQFKGDVRDRQAVCAAVRGCDKVIHLACISNDPSVELDANLSQTVNYESFLPLVRICKESGVRRFIFASSGSVYGVSDSPDVTEEHPLVPVSLYNKYKAMCEKVLLPEQTADFVPVIVRPATICGHSPRQRLDLTVNILTNHAVNAGRITVFGGTQMRPNLHIRDMIDLYTLLLEAPDEQVGDRSSTPRTRTTASPRRPRSSAKWSVMRCLKRTASRSSPRQPTTSGRITSIRTRSARCLVSCRGTRSRTQPATW